MFRIFITNLGKYNEGSLVGQWVDLPVSEDELEKVFEEIGISEEPDEKGIYYEEYFITDYETDIPGYEIHEYEPIETLNEIAEEWENLNSYEQEVVGAMMEYGCTFEEAVDEKDDCIFYWNCSDMTDVAYEIIKIGGYLEDAPDFCERYFDY